MKRWEDVKKNIRSLSQSEKEELEIAARLVAQNTKDQLLRTVERDCPICNRVHPIEERKRMTQGIVKDEIVDYEEIYYRCPVGDEEENEFVSAGLMDENLSRARNAYLKRIVTRGLTGCREVSRLSLGSTEDKLKK